MDYAFLATLIGVFLAMIVMSYDIACQWSRNLVKQVPDFPSEMHLDFTKVAVTTVIPKFHIYAKTVKVAGPLTISVGWHAQMVKK